MRLIGKRFREFRENLGMSQKEMAGACILTQSSITNFEKGKILPAVRHLIRLNNRFGLSIPWLLYGEKSMPVPVKNDWIRDGYSELEVLYFSIPEVRLLICARLEELKKLFHQEIEDFFNGRKDSSLKT